MIICDIADRRVFCFCGDVAIEVDELICRECGAKMHIHAHPEPITLRHVPFGGDLACLRIPHNRFFCPSCGATRSQYLSNSKEKKMTKKGILSERQMKLMKEYIRLL